QQPAMSVSSAEMAAVKTSSNGMWQGDDPLHFAFPLLILQTLLILLLSRVLALLLRPLRQPKVIAEIVAGILLGPSALGRNKAYLRALFPPWSAPVLESVASLGLLFFLFLVGLELDLRSVRRSGRRAFAIAAAGISLPFACGVGVAFVIRRAIPGADEAGYAPFLVFMGVAMSITAFPVLARILAELKLLTTAIGETALAAAAFNDVAAWVLLALAVAISGSGDDRRSPVTSLWVLLSGAAFVAVWMLAVKPLMSWVARRSDSGGGGSAVWVAFTLAGVLASGLATDMIGIHAIFGAFVFGLTVPKDGGFAGRVTERVEDLVSELLLPLYFASSGLKTDVATIRGGGALGILALIIVTACAGKIMGTFAVAMACGMGAKEAIVLGVLMNTKGLVELIVLNIGRERKVRAQRGDVRDPGAHGAGHHLHHHANRHGHLQAGARHGPPPPAPAQAPRPHLRAILPVLRCRRRRRRQRHGAARACLHPRRPRRAGAHQPHRDHPGPHAAAPPRQALHPPHGRAHRAHLLHPHGPRRAPQRPPLPPPLPPRRRPGRRRLRHLRAARPRPRPPHDRRLRAPHHARRRRRRRRGQARLPHRPALPQAPARRARTRPRRRRRGREPRPGVARREPEDPAGGALLRRRPRGPQLWWRRAGELRAGRARGVRIVLWRARRSGGPRARREDGGAPRRAAHRGALPRRQGRQRGARRGHATPDRRQERREELHLLHRRRQRPQGEGARRGCGGGVPAEDGRHGAVRGACGGRQRDRGGGSDRQEPGVRAGGGRQGAAAVGDGGGAGRPPGGAPGAGSHRRHARVGGAWCGVLGARGAAARRERPRGAGVRGPDRRAGP
uniref:Cation/H+ exchanger transmembrane domain-containing protein n=1 Tax=Aegilops tauschii subsp. strangulata TaxID=200361 RepID=A0A452XNM5_AEGTS